MREVVPTMFFGVPAVFMKIESKVNSLAADLGWLKRKLVNWARNKIDLEGKKVFAGCVSTNIEVIIYGKIKIIPK